MPISSPEGKSEFVHFIDKYKPQSILDIGAGKGNYGTLIRIAHEPRILHAVEVWQPYIDEFNLSATYDKVFKEDVRDRDDFQYDLVILGDILEHMEKDQAMSVWEKVSKQAKYAILSIPIGYHPQGCVHDNPYEEHVVDSWTPMQVFDCFPFIYKHEVYNTVGVFYAKFPGVFA